MPRVSFQRLAVVTASAALYFTAIEANQAFAATFTVTNTNDSGAGSLRQAIINANATPDNSIIDFLLGTSAQTITLTSGELDITNNLTINGLGANLLTVSGNKNSRVFNIGSSSVVDIAGLTIANGLNTNGFTNGFPLANITGGGILNNGTLTLTDSTLSRNTAPLGGGLGNFGSLTMINSTLSGNGGYLNGVGELMGEAGAIYNDTSGSVTLTNSTISGNTAAFGGGIENDGTLTVTNSTISGNTARFFGGGIENGGRASIGNTIIANNTSINFDFISSSDVSGRFTSLGYNLIGTSNGSIGFGVTGDLVGTSTARINPLLGPLQNNGGPTQTLALLPGSPAIDAGNPDSFPATDQRGVPRPQGSRADIGAYELQQTVQHVPEPEEETVALLSILGLSFLLKKKKAAYR